MPISNPIVNLYEAPLSNKVQIESGDPSAPPIAISLFWLNVQASRLWLSKGTGSLSDWVQIGGDIATILGAIIVENNAVVTDGKKVIWETEQ